jgi:hypothetical protein
VPYFIARQGTQHCVMKGTKEKPEGKVTCHPTREKAVAHLRALYRNVPDAKREKSDQLPPMQDTEMNALKALHDQMLAEKPEGASHDEAECLICSNDGGEPMGDALFTEEEVKAAVDRAVAEATSSLTQKITELQQSQQSKALEDAVVEAKAEVQVEIDDLTAKLDAAVLEAQQAKEAKEALQTAWDSEKEVAEEARLFASRREDRVAKVREVECFPDDYVEQNADRFAAMSDEDFDARLEEWKALLDKDEPIPKKTALTASREGNGNSNTSMLGELRNLRRVFSDPTIL